MSNDFGFIYKTLAGNEAESSLIDLQIVAEGPIDLGNGWTGDRINYDRKKSCLIEFRTGEERIPGHVDNYACEVKEDYVIEHYNISRKEIEALKGYQWGH